jgi:PIN domain
MTLIRPRFLVILDSNVWVAERLLQTTLGTALLFAITTGDGAIGLPEVVELEVGHVLTAHADQAVEAIRKNTQLLRQLSGRKVSHYVPTQSAIQAGMMDRWNALSGVLRRTIFTHEQAKAGLARVVAKLPPSGENNEQFRDACIWAAALESAKESPVHLITNDRAFFEGRDQNRAVLAKVLQHEVKEHAVDISIQSQNSMKG